MVNDTYAREVIRAGRDLGITPRGIIIGFATVFTECDWIMYANRADPQTLDFPHERIGSDSRSSGLFQQQPPWWGTVADRMDPYRSARMFFEALKKLDYNSTAHSPGWYAQKVQGSSFPDRYDTRIAEATSYYSRLSGGKEGIMGDPVWLADVLRAEGVATVEFGDWKNHGHGDFGTIWGVVAHHTGASGNSGAGSIANGRPDLPGPVSQIYLARNGVASVVAAGIAWHAGSGSWPGIPTNNANQVTIGIEADNNGTEGWSPAQYGAYVKVCAAICRKLGVRSDRVIGHKEWAGPSQGKWDPGGIDMDAFRRDIQAQIDGGAKPPPPPVNQIDEMQKVAGFWLGARETKGEVVCGIDKKGRYAKFANGYIYWHPNTGARAVNLRIFQYWAGLNWENGPLGYPVKNHAYIDGVGDIQAFERGVVFRLIAGVKGIPDDPGHHVTGVIGDSYYKRGAEAGDLGWPMSNEYDYDGGRKQDFEGGSLAWNPTGAVRITRPGLVK